MSRSTPWFLLVLCLVGLLLARESRQPMGVLAGVDRAFFDWLAANAHPLAPPARAANATAAPRSLPAITLVEIDDSVADIPGRLPLAPLEYASFFDAVGRFDPAVVAVEPVLDWPNLAAGAEQILSTQALALPRLLLSAQLGSTLENARDAASLPPIATISGSRSALADYPEIVSASARGLQSVVAATGATNLPVHGDAPVRDVPLVFGYRDHAVPGFVLETLRLALRLAPSEVTLSLGSHIQFGDRLSLPIDRAGRSLLDPRVFRRINRLQFDDLPLLATGQATPEVMAAAERMRNGVVILGRTDHAMRTLRMADGNVVSPAEVFAWAAASLEGAPSTRRASGWWDAGIIVAFALAGWRAIGWRPWAVIVLFVVVMAFYGLAALSLFEEQRLWLPIALPLGLAVTGVLLAWLLPKA